MKKYFVSYYLNSDEESISTITFIAMKEFGEVALYTDEEAKKVVDFIHTKTCPKFEEIYEGGNKTLEEWEEFRIGLNKEIKELI